jgi:phosphoenolpyruvate carboxykinase (GTP)
MCFLRIGTDGRLWAVNGAAGIDSMLGGPERRLKPARDTLLICPRGANGSPSTADALAMLGASLGAPRFTKAQAPAHARARFMAAAQHCSGLGAGFKAPDGVPISAILFGSRRTSLVPLVREAMSWEHGVYLAATLRTEAAIRSNDGTVELSDDPMAMLPYCSYNMADYFGHWLRVGSQLYRRPRVFEVNWFRTDASGRLIWPGFEDNIRVIDWILRRVEHSVDARPTPIGLMPYELDLTGLDIPAHKLDPLFQVDVGGWFREAQENWAFLKRFGLRLPLTMRREHEAFLRRLSAGNN